MTAAKGEDTTTTVQAALRGILPYAKSIELGLWTLVGNGEAYRDCGDLRYRGCLNVDEHPASLDGRDQGQVYVESFYRSCNRKECPKCYESWAGLESYRAQHRLLSSIVSAERVLEVIGSCLLLSSWITMA